MWQWSDEELSDSGLTVDDFAPGDTVLRNVARPRAGTVVSTDVVAGSVLIELVNERGRLNERAFVPGALTKPNESDADLLAPTVGRRVRLVDYGGWERDGEVLEVHGIFFCARYELRGGGYREMWFDRFTCRQNQRPGGALPPPQDPSPGELGRSATPSSSLTRETLLAITPNGLGTNVPMYRAGAQRSHGYLLCDICGEICVYPRHIYRLVRTDYDLTSIQPLTAMNGGPIPGVPDYIPSSEVKGDSLLLQFFCEGGHGWFLELGVHKGVTIVTTERIPHHG